MFQYFKISSKETRELVNQPLAPRVKEYHEIVWVKKGEAIFVVDGSLFEVTPGSFFIIPKDRYHQFLPKESIEGDVVRFSEDFLMSFPRVLFSKFHDLSEIKLSTFEKESFALLFLLFENEYAVSQNEAILRYLLRILILKLQNLKYTKFLVDLEGRRSLDLFDEFQLLLDKHIIENRKVGFYSELLGVTSRKLGEVVRSVLNDTTENAISKRLLIEVKRQLMYTSKSVSEISYEMRFVDSSYFTKFFKKFTGITPKEYRVKYFFVK